MAIKPTFNKFPLVYLITDGATNCVNFKDNLKQLLALIQAAVEAKVSLIQIREKQLSANLLFELAQSAARITRQTETLLLVNDRADIAQAAGADGVHLTANSVSAQVIRQNFRDSLIIGVSAHSMADVQRARRENADFVTFSPIFSTPSKNMYGEPQGLEALREVCYTCKDFPIIALGGIDEKNFPAIVQTGASGVAAIRFLSNADKLKQIVAKIRDEWEKSENQNCVPKNQNLFNNRRT